MEGKGACEGVGCRAGTQSDQTEPRRAAPSQAKPSQAKPSQAKPSQAKPSQAKPSQAKPSRTGQGFAALRWVSLGLAELYGFSAVLKKLTTAALNSR
jgi:hypothetical protein